MAEKQASFLTFDVPGNWKMALGIATGVFPLILDIEFDLQLSCKPDLVN